MTIDAKSSWCTSCALSYSVLFPGDATGSYYIIDNNYYLQVHFSAKTPFASTKFSDFYAEMVQGRQILVSYTTIAHVANNY